jgi:hypothetical protein
MVLGTALAAWQPGYYQTHVDNSTYANADEVHTTHFHLDWLVDFNHEHVAGAVTHDLEVLEDTDHIVFDNWLIEILACE